MVATLSIRDEITLDGTGYEFTLDFASEKITVQELIRSRVYQEVKDYNVRQTEYFCGLVKPTDAEKTLNGYKLSKPRQLDWEKQYETAIASFQSNGFLILVGDRQVDDLEEVIEINSSTSVTFLKLIPLVGG